VVIGATGAGAPSATVVKAATLAPRAVGGIDPALGLVEVGVDLDALDGDELSVTGSWADATAAAQRAISHEMIGAMRTMLRLAREHALDRIQFDRPISSFQAVRHRLAESHVAIEGAAGAVDAAWDDGTPLTAAAAKAIAGHSARTVRRHCQQVLAGIGFTTEHDLHLFVRRTLVLDALYGDSRALTKQIGADLLAARGLPALLPL
jgi:alkylation response protein AidB-like acyl-CoA dehydrogenase